jgi:Flp pilus assembly protein CpaB
MRKPSGLIALGFAGISGLAYLGSQVYIDHQLDLIHVPIAAMTLPVRTTIDDSHIRWIAMPRAYVPDSIIVDEFALIGQLTRLDGRIEAGSFFTTTSLESPTLVKDGANHLLKEGQAVFTLSVDVRSTAGNTLLPFQRVDLYFSLQHQQSLIVDKLIGNVRILAIKDKQGLDVKSAKDLPKYVLIAVESSLIPILTKAMALGELTLTPSIATTEAVESVAYKEQRLWKVLHG